MRKRRPLKDITFDDALPEKLAVVEACQKLDALGVRYSIKNHVLRIPLYGENAILFTPTIGSLRWAGCPIFSSQGWPLLCEILQAAGLIGD